MLETAQEWIDRLELQPLETEGGFYREVARSDETMAADKLPVRYQSPRSMYTAIYYLVTPESHSALHQLQTDEYYSFIAGDPVSMLLLYETGTGQEVTLGNSGAADVEPSLVVPRRVWQGCSLVPGGRFALMTTAMAPGYDRLDFLAGRRASLTETYPAFADRIADLTPAD